MIGVYLFLFFLITISFLHYKEGCTVDTRWLKLLFIILIIMAALRPETMRDYRDYEESFSYMTDARLERGFAYLIMIFKTISSNFRLFLAFIATFAIGLKLYILYKKENYIFWGCFLIYFSILFLLQDLIAIRAGLACALLLLSSYFIFNRKLGYFIVTVLIASTIHTSALIFLPFYFLRYSEKFNKVFIILLIVSYVLALSNHLVGLFIERVNLDYVQRLWTYYGTQDTQNGNIFAVKTVLRTLTCLYLLINIDKVNKIKEYYCFFVYVFAISICLYLICSDVPVLSTRLSELLQFSEIISVPLLTYVIQNKLLAKCIIVGYAASYVFLNVFYAGLL